MAIRVAGSIDGRPLDVLVDTGAEKTFVHEDLLPTRGISSSGQQLCGVTGDCVPMRGPVWVDLTVGAVTERLPVYIAAMEDSCLLDYLSRVEACVALHSGRMMVKGHEVPLNPGGHAPPRMVEEQERCESYVAAFSPRASTRCRCRHEHYHHHTHTTARIATATTASPR